MMNKTVLIFFAGLLLLGIFVFDDYGLSADEPFIRISGIKALKYVQGNSDYLEPYEGHGPLLKMFFVILENKFQITESKSFYLMRHFITFIIFFIGVCFFYILCTHSIKDWKMGLLGSLFLILSPRIFAHAFYNIKDIPFLSLFIISMYTLIRYLDEKTIGRATLHALSCAFLINIRIIGVIAPILTITFVFLDCLLQERKPAKAASYLSVYLILFTFFAYLFWPTLWRSPIRNLTDAMTKLSSFGWANHILYMGQEFHGGEKMPWHYVPVWITITTPLLYIVLFIIGSAAFIVTALRERVNLYAQKKHELIFAAWLVVPLAGVILLNAAYNGWRHMFFIYPALLLFALKGAKHIFQYISNKAGTNRIMAHRTFMGIIIIGLLFPGVFMLRHHPHQYMYFNALSGGMDNVKGNFDLDYWGLTYKEGLEYILKTDKSNKIMYYIFYGPARNTIFMLSPEERSRLSHVRDPKKAKYILTNFRGGYPIIKWYMDLKYPYEKCYSIKIGDTSIMDIYKLY